MLPQLAVSAKILCLLMVVICGAVPSMVRSVRLYSQCSHMYVNVFPNGTVMARSDGNDQPNLTISTRGYSLDLLIHSPVQDMYLCFNRSRLVGRRLTRSQAERQPNCLFKEEFVNGYNRYHLVKNEDRYIGFNRRGAQLRRVKSRYTEKQQMCFYFMKRAHDFDLDRHNTLLAGDLTKWRPPRRFRPMSQNSIKPPCHGVRHHHGRHQRRRNCDGT
ncbi:fibroblast growth factor 17-like isoform X2 [Epargyreus clarus]|uniref:fibroblast growth factor 17-like isoform X2 n=1 Tax=Epargyreus clarus TaxID=520877 RepID=UPI003C2F0180